MGSPWYALAFDAPPAYASTQPGWRWCNKCQGLHYSPLGGTGGSCPAGGPHDAAGSGVYHMPVPPYAAGESGWTWCSKCQGLNHDNQGACPAGQNHSSAGSGQYLPKLDVAPTLAGNSHHALHFDGVDDYVELPPSDLDFTRGLTIEAWVAYEAFTHWARIVDFGNGTTENVILAIEGPTPDVAFHINAGDKSSRLVARGALDEHKWIHLAATIDAAGTGRIYRNGELLASGAMLLPARVARANNYVGKSNWPDSFFKGRMSDLRVWTVARTQGEIQADMRRRLAGNEEGLAAYLRLDEPPAAAALRDASRNAHTGAPKGNIGRERSTLALAAARPETQVLALAAPDGRVELPTLDVDPARGLSLELWVMCGDAPAGASRLVEFGNGPDSDTIALNCDIVNRDIELEVCVGGARKAIGARVLVPGKWTHFAATIDAAGFARIFRDGVQIQSGALALPTRVARKSCYLGKSTRPGAVAFVGKISDVRLWTAPRTVAEINAGMTRRLVGDEAGLAAYWRLDDEDGAVARDARLAAVRCDGALKGSATWRRGKPELSDWCVGLASAAHEGKVVLVATRHDGQCYYTIKQAGFEDSALAGATRIEGWEDWKPLDLPEQTDDASVLARERAELTRQSDPDQFVLRSRYHTRKTGMAAPAQLVSGMGHLHVVRPSITGTLLVDRFVLDGMTNVLVPKLEVRFKRSKQRYAAAAPAGQLDADFDTLDFTDTAGNPFYEPSTELCALGPVGGGFAVVLLPTGAQDRSRWHFFSAAPGATAVEIASIRSAEDGLFDVADHRSLVSGAVVPGLLHATITLPAAVTGGLAATRYDVQEERETETGERQLVRTATRVLLAVPTADGTVTLSFAASLDGTLADVDGDPITTILRADRREVHLPLGTLDDVRPIGADAPLQGVITRIERSGGNQVLLTASNAAQLELGDVVRIKDTARYDGLHTVTRLDADTFAITAPWVGTDLGKWEQVKPHETGQLFDGIITGFRAQDGALRVRAFNHLLQNGDQVHIVGTTSQDGDYPVTARSTGAFEVGRTWQPGEAVNLRLRQAVRRGVTFGAAGQRIDVPGAKAPTGNSSYTVEAWIRPQSLGDAGIVGWGDPNVDNRCVILRTYPGGLILSSKNHDLWVAAPELTSGWHHVAATYDAASNTRRVFVDGVQKGSDQPSAPLAVPAPAAGFAIGELPGLAPFAGTIADVRVWSVARPAAQLLAAMHSPLTGREVGLCGNWRLGAILEGPQPRVVDMGPHGTDGLVMGGALVSGKLLKRTPTGWNQPAVRYQNDDLVAVTQGGTYEESIEYRVIGESANSPAKFRFVYWGRRSRDADDVVAFPGGAVVTTPLEGEWRRATCRFTVPEGAALVRAFEIGDLEGTWDTLEIRRHRIEAQSRVISEQRRTAAPTLQALGGAASGQSADLERLDARLRVEALLLAERADLKAKIALAQNRTQTQADLDASTARRAALVTKLAQLRDQRASMESEKLQFWCRITARHSGKPLDVLAWGAHGNVIGQYTDNGASNQRFRGVPMGVGYAVLVMYSGLAWEIAGGSLDDNARLVQTAFVSNRLSQRFRFARLPNGYYNIIPLHATDKALDIAGASGDDGAHVIQFRYHNDANQQFVVERMGESEVTAKVLADIAAAEADIAAEDQLIARLNAILAATAAQIAAWQARVAAIELQLPPIQSDIGTTSAQVLGVALAPPASMPVLATDARGLRISGGILPALRPAGALSAVETCEGNVQLSCFDADGRLIQAEYDVTADSQDATFEQWRPAQVRAALACAANTHRLALEGGVGGGGEWTVEAWFFWPLPPAASNTLFAGGGDAHVTVRDGRWLGTAVAGRGFLGGYDLSRLAPGWHHIAATAGAGGEATTTFFVDGRRLGDTRTTALTAQRAVVDAKPAGEARQVEEKTLEELARASFRSTSAITCIGNNAVGVDGQPFGLVAEARVWTCALSPAELAAHARSTFTGREPGLAAYYTMRKSPDQRVAEATGAGPIARAHGITELACSARIGGSEAVFGQSAACAEYSTIGVRPGSGGQRMAVMRRCLACLTDGGVKLYADRRVEELDLVWLGNAQFAPTLLGYIEGAPPVPSENLTLQDSYAGATSVELSMSEDTTYSWVRTKQDDRGASVSAFIGVQLEKDAGDIAAQFLPTSKLYQSRFGDRANYAASSGSANETAVTAQASNLLSDRLELRGTTEAVARFPHLGRRFVPKNVGYALVVSSIADVYVTRLRKSGRMIGYEVRPDPKRPPDINTVTFLINPAYTMNGSLDGLTGSAATSDRFFRHVPAMRAQHGSRYPASYYRLEEAYRLRETIERKDRDRETYFQNFNPKITGSGTDGQVERAIGDAGASDAPAQASGDPSDAKKAAIERRYGDRSAALQATTGLERWQQKMNDLRLRAGKRNIVNTYVWDADGGLRSEVQQFASTIEHSIGSAVSSSLEFGFEASLYVQGLGAELTYLANLNHTETLSKAVATGRGFALDVSLDGVESAGITNHKDIPLMPGEKVNRYRFMSYYLEGETAHFDAFFSTVVDPEWLAGNSESARALRQVRGRPNKTWRILHRVTYVERPALASFGQDTRPLTPSSPPAPSLADQVADIQTKQAQLEAKLDLIIQLLKQPN